MKTIEITTTQKVTIEYELAGLRDRFLAQLIDYMVIFGIGLVLYLLLLAAFNEEVTSDNGERAAIIAGLLPLFLYIMYHFLSELLMDGQSIGKKSVGIKVVRLDGKEVTPSDYLLRAIFHFIDSVLSVYILGSMLISSTDKSQRLGDLAANTAVIKVKFNLRFRLEDILKINSLADYEPLYPEIRQFSEEDMLLIKSVIARSRQYGNDAHKQVINQLVRDLMLKLDVRQEPRDKIHFLKTLIKDYIVLTR